MKKMCDSNAWILPRLYLYITYFMNIRIIYAALAARALSERGPFFVW